MVTEEIYKIFPVFVPSITVNSQKSRFKIYWIFTSECDFSETNCLPLYFISLVQIFTFQLWTYLFQTKLIIYYTKIVDYLTKIWIASDQLFYHILNFENALFCKSNKNLLYIMIRDTQWIKTRHRICKTKFKNSAYAVTDSGLTLWFPSMAIAVVK